MSRLLSNGEWFDAVAPESIYETDFEGILLRDSEYLYPSYIAAKFKRRVESEHGIGIPDLALIDRQYREWLVVEVELSIHQLRGDVERQVAIFATGAYGRAHAEYLASANVNLQLNSLIEMMRGRQPRVMVIVERLKPAWIEALAKWDALVSVVELFRSPRGYMLRVEGARPEPPQGVVSMCRLDRSLNWLTVDSPASLGVAPGEELKIWMGDGITIWHRRDSGSRVWLVPARRNPLAPSGSEYELLRRQDGSFQLLHRR